MKVRPGGVRCPGRAAAAVLRVVRRDGRSDRGSATVWSVAVIAALCVVFGVVLALGQAVVARHRAAGGADLAALAAADHWARGGAAACARAEHVARAQSARLVRCEVTGRVSDVTAASGRGPFEARVRARAGPAGPAPGGPVPPVGPSGEAPPAGTAEDVPPPVAAEAAPAPLPLPASPAFPAAPARNR
ncbi:Rv3654c family TadE-like protein [Streptomyces sp. enrichment culture]|uniref:Rv3654c family TadE-like protein n=1 Tax=Streptomyces sp. enrichment culture TaxID=1795815 RepID=UPI003F574B9F